MEIQVLVNDVQIWSFTLQVTAKKNALFSFFLNEEKINIVHVTAHSNLKCIQLGEVVHKGLDTPYLLLFLSFLGLKKTFQVTNS